MAFFDPGLAAQLQYVTLPLEAIGLGLAAVEIRMPGVSARLVAWINATEARLDAAEEERRAVETSPLQRFIDRSFPIRSGLGTRFTRLTTVVTFTLVLILSAAYAGRGLGVLDAELVQFVTDRFVDRALLGLALLVLVSTVFYLTLRFATRFAAGREVGNLGLLIAAFGLLGELYQFLTPLLA